MMDDRLDCLGRFGIRPDIVFIYRVCCCCWLSSFLALEFDPTGDLAKALAGEDGLVMTTTARSDAASFSRLAIALIDAVVSGEFCTSREARRRLFDAALSFFLSSFAVAAATTGDGEMKPRFRMEFDDVAFEVRRSDVESWREQIQRYHHSSSAMLRLYLFVSVARMPSALPPSTLRADVATFEREEGTVETVDTVRYCEEATASAIQLVRRSESMPPIVRCLTLCSTGNGTGDNGDNDNKAVAKPHYLSPLPPDLQPEISSGVGENEKSGECADEEEEDVIICSVCHETEKEAGADMRRTSCGHHFCLRCIMRWCDRCFVLKDDPDMPPKKRRRRLPVPQLGAYTVPCPTCRGDVFCGKDCHSGARDCQNVDV